MVRVYVSNVHLDTIVLEVTTGVHWDGSKTTTVRLNVGNAHLDHSPMQMPLYVLHVQKGFIVSIAPQLLVRWDTSVLEAQVSHISVQKERSPKKVLWIVHSVLVEPSLPSIPPTVRHANVELVVVMVLHIVLAVHQEPILLETNHVLV